MRTAVHKDQILEDAGYRYNFDRSLYVNRRTRTAFSVEFVEDHAESVLETLANQQASESGEWRFHFNDDPSTSVKQELSAVLR